jgi:hypothetical protein
MSLSIKRIISTGSVFLSRHVSPTFPICIKVWALAYVNVQNFYFIFPVPSVISTRFCQQLTGWQHWNAAVTSLYNFRIITHLLQSAIYTYPSKCLDKFFYFCSIGTVNYSPFCYCAIHIQPFHTQKFNFRLSCSETVQEYISKK